MSAVKGNSGSGGGGGGGGGSSSALVATASSPQSPPSSPSQAITTKSPSPSRGPAESWFCHCCRFENKGLDAERDTCRVCGRHESYAQEGYPLPLHGKGGAMFRPSQIINVLTEINETDDVNWTPLHNACVTGNAATALKLIELGAFLEAATDKGQTALHLAVYAGSKETCRALLNRGANPNAVTRYELLTPLHMACDGGWREIVLMLLAAGANPNVYDKMERTPLHLAALKGRADMGAALIREGAQVEAKDCHGWNARQFAELMAHNEFVELVVRNSGAGHMAVLKEMPPAEWHCELWSEVVESTQRVKAEVVEAERKLRQFQDEVRVARERAQREREGQEEIARRERLAERARQRAAMQEQAERAREAMIKDLESCQATTDNAAMALGSLGGGRRAAYRAGAGAGGRGGGGGGALAGGLGPRVVPPASLLGLSTADMKELKARVDAQDMRARKARALGER